MSLSFAPLSLSIKFLCPIRTNWSELRALRPRRLKCVNAYNQPTGAEWTLDNTICKRRNSLIVTSWKKLHENRIASDKSVSGGTNLISKYFLIKSCRQVAFFSLGECLICYHDANVDLGLNVRLHWTNVNAKAMSLPDGLLFTKTKENFTFAFPFAQCKWTLNKK